MPPEPVNELPEAPSEKLPDPVPEEPSQPTPNDVSVEPVPEALPEEVQKSPNPFRPASIEYLMEAPRDS
jgi:hypothetical protein